MTQQNLKVAGVLLNTDQVVWIGVVVAEVVAVMTYLGSRLSACRKQPM